MDVFQGLRELLDLEVAVDSADCLMVAVSEQALGHWVVVRVYPYRVCFYSFHSLRVIK